MKFIVNLAAIAALSLGASAAWAAEPNAVPASAVKGYLDAKGLPDVAAAVGRPPEPGDDAWIEEGRLFKRLRALKDTPRWAQAQYDNSYDMDTVLAAFSCPMGVQLSRAKTPAIARLIGRAVLDTTGGARIAKNQFKRQRPYVPTDEAICIEREPDLDDSFSYPSGHGTSAWTYGMLLAQIAPADRAGPLYRRARAYAESRLVCGVHWKSDVEAGHEAAEVVLGALQSNPEFRKDVDAARAELAATTGAPTRDCAAQAAIDALPLN